VIELFVLFSVFLYAVVLFPILNEGVPEATVKTPVPGYWEGKDVIEELDVNVAASNHMATFGYRIGMRGTRTSGRYPMTPHFRAR